MFALDEFGAWVGACWRLNGLLGGGLANDAHRYSVPQPSRARAGAAGYLRVQHVP